MRKELEEFIVKAVMGHDAECLANIHESFPVFDAVGKKLKESGISNPKIIEMRYRNFSVTCPECNMKMDGSNFATCFLLWADYGDANVASLKKEQMPDGQILTIAELEGGGAITVRGTGKAIRFYMGQCINNKCRSNHVIMEWHPTNVE